MKSPLVYVGGKSKLSKQIIDLIPDHKTYCEVFAGAGWVFFRKEQSLCEVINDKDGDLVTFYRVVQNHLEEFLKQLKGRGLTDIQKAARYYYLQRLCFGGAVKNRPFGVVTERKPRINLLRLEEEMSAVHLRLCNVVIENLEWGKILAKYDKPETFFYLDPPYYSAPCYKHNFKGIEDYQNLNQILSQIQGKFLLSINDCEEIREVFKDFQIKPVELNYSIKKDAAVKGRELLISNYDIGGK